MNMTNFRYFEKLLDNFRLIQSNRLIDQIDLESILDKLRHLRQNLGKIQIEFRNKQRNLEKIDKVEI